VALTPGNASTTDRWTVPPLFAAAVGVLGCVVLYLRDPAEGAPFPACPFHALTGLDCPLCGSGRALHRLLHGRLHEAFSLNPLFVLSIPLGLAFAATLTGVIHITVRRWATWTYVAVVIVFTVARNLPWGPVAWMSSYH